MKQSIILVIICIFSCISSCTVGNSREFVITNDLAYIRGDDSLNVVSYLDTIDQYSNKITVNIDTTGVILPVPVEMKRPTYPHQGKFLIEGTVWVQMWITEEGQVKRAYIKKTTHPLFNQACLEAAMQWEFKPATKNGQPISCWVSIPFRFRF